MRLVITRPLKEGRPLKKKLEKSGHKVWLLPMIEIRPSKDGGRKLRRALKNIERYQWLILASHNAERAVASYFKKSPSPFPSPPFRGRGKGEGVKVVFVGKTGVTGLISFFKRKKIAGEKILYPMSNIGRKELVRFLRKKGAKVDVIEAYRTEPAKWRAREVEKILARGIDAVLFYSPSAVAGFFRKKISATLLKNLRFVPFGETTARAIKKEGYSPARSKIL